MTYTLLFGNNFISDSPKSVKCGDTTLFFLGEDYDGPYLTTRFFDISGKRMMLNINRNVCDYCTSEYVLKRNERSHILIDNKERENIIQSRILDKRTILVSGIFSINESVLVVTQNYVVSLSGNRIMHDRISAKNGSVLVTEAKILPED